jgi:ABC-type branched-subunit amino acid transport system ATPase component
MLRNLAQLRHGQRFGLVSSGVDGEGRAGGRALTAAEVRCLTIGTELVNRPGLVFLEDPFADLQWQDSEKVSFFVSFFSVLVDTECLFAPF